jgi:hypothetical protein
LLVASPKSTFGAATAFEPRAFLRKATWAFSSAVTRFRKADSWAPMATLFLVASL